MNATAIIVVVVILAAVAGAVLFMKKRSGGGSSPPLAPPAPAAEWTFQHCKNMPAAMLDGYFDFPPLDGVHYLVRATPGGMLLDQSVTLTFELVGDGKLVPSEQDAPTGMLRLYFQRAGDDLMAVGEKEHYRWWSHEAVILLVPGTYTISVPLKPAAWSSVYGASGDAVPALFAAAVANSCVVGMTFGASGAGHGVFVKDGSARFTLKNFMVGAA